MLKPVFREKSSRLKRISGEEQQKASPECRLIPAVLGRVKADMR